MKLLHILVSFFLVEAIKATSTSHVSISFGDTDISYKHDHDVPTYHSAAIHTHPYIPQEPIYHSNHAYRSKPVQHTEPVHNTDSVHKPKPEPLKESKITNPRNKSESMNSKYPIDTLKPKSVHKNNTKLAYKPKSKPTHAPDPYPHSHHSESYQPEPYQPEPYQPEPYQPEPYQPEPYQPELYQPDPYQPEPYQPENVHHPKPSYKHHNEIPSCSELSNNTWCIEDDDYPEYDIKQAIQYHLDSFNGFYADVADLNTALSVDRPNTIEEETYLCSSDISYIRPLRALNTEGKWRIIINDINLHYKTFTQNARVEQCLNGGMVCPKVPLCYDSKCLQKSTYVRLLIFDAYDQYFPFAIETFKLPASCACLLGSYTINH